jgi:hypothetical protein
MTQTDAFPPPGLCSLSALPEPYQTAFRLGTANHLPGQFLPAQTDWFVQVCLFPFMVMYASPLLTLVPALLHLAIREPGRYGQFWQTITRQGWADTGLMVGLLLLGTVLIGVCSYQAWEMALSFSRTWQMSRMRRRGDQGYGVVLLSHAMVGRFVDNVGRHNCLWLPKRAIANILWQQMREEGAKRSYWVYRTRIRYLTVAGDSAWLTLKGDMVQLGYPMGDKKSDQALYDLLTTWWHEGEVTA